MIRVVVPAAGRRDKKAQQIHALAPMLEALRIKQVVSHDECAALWLELHTACGNTPPPFSISGNQWTALVNLALARFAHKEQP